MFYPSDEWARNGHSALRQIPKTSTLARLRAAERRIMTSEPKWIADARRELLALRGGGRAWGYRRDASPCSEPTALSALALLATSSNAADATEGASACNAAAAWLASAQQPDGSVAVSSNIPKPGWMTPHAMLLWSALSGWDESIARAAAWLDQQKGTTVNPLDNLDRVAGHDTSLVGWPWVSETHSWLEPTALAVLALSQQSDPTTRARLDKAKTLIRDRAIATGGWNYGNKAVFGRSLRPQPAPTGIALLALAGTDSNNRMIQAAVRYLREVLPKTRAAAALGWGLLGLRAWGIELVDSSLWLSESHARVTGRPDAPMKLAQLLLGSTRASLPLFHRGGASSLGGDGDVR